MQVASKISDPDQFHEAIRQQYGMSFEEFRDKLKRQYLAQRVIGQEVGYRIQIPEAELQKYYEEHKGDFVRKEQVFLSQILISTEGKTPEQAAVAEQKAKDLVARAKKGEKFSDLVRANSDDPETARTGGSLPPYQRGMMEKTWDDQVFAAAKGDIVGPLKGPLGFVILRVDERYAAGQASFEEVRNEIQERMARPKMEPKVREFLTTLRQEAFLEIKEGYVDSGAGARQGYALARCGAIEAADHHQGRSGRADQDAQALHEHCARSGNREADPRKRAGDSRGQAAACSRRRRAAGRARRSRCSCQTMKSPYVNEVEPNKVITTSFLVHSKEIRQKKSSAEFYLSLLLGDRTGELDAKMWDNVARGDRQLRPRRFRQGQGADPGVPQPAAVDHPQGAPDGRQRNRLRRLFPVLEARSRRDVERAAAAWWRGLPIRT